MARATLLAGMTSPATSASHAQAFSTQEATAFHLSRHGLIE